MKRSNQFPPIHLKLRIFLAEDDEADCLLFKDALEELPVLAQLTTFNNGEQLMEWFSQKENQLPDMLFLDLHIPRKNGFASLGEIKRNDELNRLPVVIFSSAFEQKRVNQVFRDAAHYYIHKPAEFSELKKVIYNALTLVTQEHNRLPGKENFILKGDLKSNSNDIESPSKKSPGKIS